MIVGTTEKETAARLIQDSVTEIKGYDLRELRK